MSLLHPLDVFYAREGLALPPATAVAGDAVPEPFRQLLVHTGDMTPTLEAFHGESIHIRPLQRLREDGAYLRQVLLILDGSLRPVEFGAIVIYLEQFPPEAQDLVLGEHCPLGTILRLHQIEHAGHPQAFLRVESDGVMNAALGLERSHTLYGRRNLHVTPDGRVLADILEILPPAPTAGARE